VATERGGNVVPGSSVRRIFPALCLVALIAGVYGQVFRHEFLALDDGQYVTENTHVLPGLGWTGLGWAFTTFHTGNWHPLAWLSHMLDVELFGLWAGGHHLMNVALHAVNAVLLFLLLRRITGSVYRSGIVAALFAVHPLHVESVAWVSERKDVLCTLFFLLSIGAYAGYVERPGAARYVRVAIFFVLALLSKPMAVTLPFVLLLLDAWPLGRLRISGGGDGGIPPARLVLEKVPLMALSLGSCIVTYAAQRSAGAASPLDVVTLGSRIANALVSYAAYLGKAVWPSSLSVFYPHPAIAGDGYLAWQVAASGVFLSVATFGALWQARGRPYLAVGWFWFLGMLVPVIGLVQVGGQSMADRYTYLPLIGVFLAATWGAWDGIAGRAPGRLLPGALAGMILIALSVSAHRQTGYWRNSELLFGRALQVRPGNWLAHNSLAYYRIGQGRNAEAMAHLGAVLAVRPMDPHAHNNMGIVLYRLGRREQAVPYFLDALRLDPGLVQANYNLGVILEEQGKLVEAEGHYRRASRGGALRPPPAGGAGGR